MSTALYVGIDLQKGFLSEAILATDYSVKVMEFVRSLDADELLLTKFVNQLDSAFVRYLDWDAMQNGDDMISLFGELDSVGAEVIDKSGYTAWVPRVIEKAGLLGATDIVLFGLDTDVCVLKTAMDVFEAGLRPVVLSDLCQSDGGPDRHDIGLTLLRSSIGGRQVIRSGEL